MSKKTGGPVSRLLDLIMGRIHSRVIDLTQKVKRLDMKQQEISTRLRAVAQKVRDDRTAIDAEVQALKDKIADGDEIDVESDFEALDSAVAGLDDTAGQAHSTATAVETATTGRVPEDISGVSPTDAASQAGGQEIPVSSPGGGAVDAQPAGRSTTGAANLDAGGPQESPGVDEE